MIKKAAKQASLEGNLTRFILFRLLYTARFYYPVLTILFLDYGLTLEQFGILNLAWALSIVFAEVPSGALADIFGRKRLLVVAASLMVVEMSLLAFVPLGASPFLFVVFLINRICSGFSEAAASGADEALAYDSLKALGREGEWAALLEKSTRVVSVGFFSAMMLGAFVYDGSQLNAVLHYFNPQWQLSAQLSIRMPVLLTLLSALVVLLTTLGFQEPVSDTVSPESAGSRLGAVREAWGQILAAGRWTLGHRFVLFVILAALALDSVARQFVVLASEYYRLIDIPVSWFGAVGAGMSLLGIVSARAARVMVNRLPPLHNFFALSGLLLLSLAGLAFALPLWGVMFAAGCFVILGMVQFQTSFYLNQMVDSRQRATVLSFRGLALNLGLGLASMLYTVWVGVIKSEGEPSTAAEVWQGQVFLRVLDAFPVYFLALSLGLALLAWGLRVPRAVFLRIPQR
ncbi:MAG: MFS transporter [Pseudomonadales bacterium]|nr:MFS transporter [Pseudomonadales bacterium]MCP5329999.1 MFS transporter [Pseudomonadales bacterium]MCP5343093.1 MFS transporter [Pseudomonadales bacterium]